MEGIDDFHEVWSTRLFSRLDLNKLDHNLSFFFSHNYIRW